MIPIDNEWARLALERATDRFVGLLRTAPDGPVPHSNWTIRQTALHVVASLADYGESLSGVRALRPTDPDGGPTNAQIRAVNATRMREIGDHDVQTLAEMVSATVERFLDATAGHPGETPYDWYGKCQSTLAGMTCIMLGEVTLHGYDIARAVRAPWPIDQSDAVVILLGAFALLPAYVDTEAASGVCASYVIALRRGPRVGVRFADGEATVDYPPTAPFDCRINVEPAAMVLVSYGRVSPLVPVLRGQMLAWGRKPWLALKFDRMIMNP